MKMAMRITTIEQRLQRFCFMVMDCKCTAVVFASRVAIFRRPTTRARRRPSAPSLCTYRGAHDAHCRTSHRRSETALSWRRAAAQTCMGSERGVDPSFEEFTFPPRARIPLSELPYRYPLTQIESVRQKMAFWSRRRSMTGFSRVLHGQSLSQSVLHAFIQTNQGP